MAQGITAVKLEPDGFALFAARGKIAEVKWSDIDRLRAYQHNVFMYDLTCIDIHVGNSDNIWILPEDAEGFPAFNDACKQGLKGFNKNWEATVRATTNSENSLVIYSRAPLSGRA